jgi:hypothetical protein
MKQLSSLAIALLLLLFVQSGTNAQEPDPCFERGGSINEETSHCVVASGLSFEVAYPLELIDYPFAMTIAEDFLNTSRQAFLDDFALNGVPSSGAWSLMINYELFQMSDEILSIRFDIGVYTGGAHGNQAIQSYNFDLANESVLSLAELFISEEEAIATIAPIAQAQLAETLGDMADTDWITTGAGADALNYQDFVLTEDSIIFYFEPYVVAAYAAGTQQVEIPLSDLSAILHPDFAAAAS